MPWPIPQLQIRPKPDVPGVGSLLLIVLVCIVLSGLVGLLNCKDGTYVAKDFWRPAAYACAQSYLLIGGLVGFYGDHVSFKNMTWNDWRVDRLRAWQQWTHNPLAVIASHVLLPEPDVAARMAGLEPNPPEAATAATVLFPDEILAAGHFRFERICSELLTAVGPTVTAACTRSRATLHVWLQCPTPLTDQDCDQVREQMSTLGLPKPQKIAVLDNAKVLEAQETCRADDGIIHLMLALQYHVTADDDAPEGAAALVLATGWQAQHYGLTVRNKLFRHMDTTASKLVADMQVWVERGQQPKDQIKQLWLGNLDKSTQHSIKTLVGDMALPLRQNPPAFGVFEPEKSLGRFGPVTHWLMLALSTELVACNQGSQALALGSAEQIKLQMTGLAECEWHRFGNAGDIDYSLPALGIVMLVWAVALAIVAVPISLYPNGDNTFVLCIGGILAVLAFGAPFAHYALCRDAWKPQFEWEVQNSKP